MFVPKDCGFCPELKIVAPVVFVVPPNTELVLVPLLKHPKALPKGGLLPNTGFEVVFVLPNIDVVFGEAKPPLNGLTWLPNVVLFPKTLEVEVLPGTPN